MDNINFFKRIIKGLPVVMLLALCVLVIYAASANKLPMFDIQHASEGDEDNSVNISLPDDNSAGDSVSGAESRPDQNSIYVSAAISRFPTEYPDNYVLTDGCYSEDMKLVLIKHLDQLPEGTTLLPRMGYIFSQDSDGKQSVFNSSYELLFDTLPDGYSFAGLRDADDNPLFIKDKDYYYLSSTTLEFVKTLYEDARNTRGVQFDYPSYYGRYQDEITVRKKASGGWGLYNTEDGSYEIYPNKEYVFTFGGSALACVIERNSERLRFYNIRGNSITQEYYRPLTTGIESLGYFHFVNGLTRVRRVYTVNKVKYSEECLMYDDKSLFLLPADFTLVTYGDGILQLKKDDKYGYMSWTGAWITDPVYTEAEPFIEGLAVVGRDGKYGVIDTSGNYVVPVVFDAITNCSGGVIILYDSESGYYILNKTQAGSNDIIVDLD